MTTAREDVAKSKGGRPTRSAALQRDLRLLDVATRLFMERGYDATTIDAVAEAARVSKLTVYSRYRDKRGLFEAALKREIGRWIAPLANAVEERKSDPKALPLEKQLLGIGRKLQELAIRPEVGAIGRILASQAANFPELAQLAHEEGWERAVSTLARLFDHLDQHGLIEVADSSIAAETFLNIAVATPMRNATFGIPIDQKAQDKLMRGAIKLFLSGVQPRQG